MNKKYYNYILLFIVALVWGTIIWKLLNKDSDNDEAYFAKPEIKQQLSNTKRDTFALELNYSDPFLKQTKRAYTAIKKTKTKKRTKPIVKKAAMQWPLIEYKGYIVNKKLNKKIAILKINNKQDYFEIGKSNRFNINLLNIKENSVKIKYKSETKEVKKL